MEKFSFEKIDFNDVKTRMAGMESHRWCLVAAGVTMILLGLYAMFHPGTAILSLAIFIGIGFAISGVNHIIAYFAHKDEAADHPGWFLAQGIFEIVLAFILLANLGVTALSIPIMVAFWSMMDGVMRCSAAFKFKKAGIDKWWILLVSGIISILFALLLISRPFAGVIAVTFLLGLMLIVWGATALFETYHFYKIVKS